MKQSVGLIMSYFSILFIMSNLLFLNFSNGSAPKVTFYNRLDKCLTSNVIFESIEL